MHASILFELLIVLLCFPHPLLGMLCPQGFWPTVKSRSSKHGFKLVYNKDIDEPICQFCPNVGCYIAQYKSANLTIKTSAETGSDQDVLSVPSSISSDAPGEQEEKLVASTTDATASSTTSPSPPSATGGMLDDLFMSCDERNNLPRPSNIVTYLDCVMIGSKTDYFLFIYQPRFGPPNFPVVDCVDANFLKWIDEGHSLLGLELGFKMKALPPFLFRYYPKIMGNISYIGIDGTELVDTKPEELERFNRFEVFNVIFRNVDGLKRDRKPAKGKTSTVYSSDEELPECPQGELSKNQDCQLKDMSKKTDVVLNDEALEQCRLREVQQKFEKLQPTANKETESDGVPTEVLSASLSILVILLIIGIVVAFCITNAEKLVLCRSRQRKRREALLEAEEQAAREAAELAAAIELEKQNAEQQQQMAWHPIYGRLGMVPPSMGGAFGMFAPRPNTYGIPTSDQMGGPMAPQMGNTPNRPMG